jgi:tRNA dimethylallyltransferase
VAEENRGGTRGPAAPDVPEHPLVAVVGPTGSGKSDLALAIAEEYNGEVVNCDSIQVFRYFDIGAAKTPLSERRGIPHHLIDIADPDELFTAGEYARLARQAIADITARGRLPVVAGGTGFYLRALLDGLFEGPARDQALRDRLAAREARRPGSLHRLLRRFDREAASKIHPNDVPKVTRAVEVGLLTRRPVSELFREGRDGLEGYRTLKLGLLPDRDALYDRVNLRCERMFAEGLVEEARRIEAMGYGAAKPFESVGYKQAMQLVRRELSPRDALLDAQRDTRNYAKRQITWFRREAGLVWLRGFGDDVAIRADALARVKDFAERFR